MEQRNTEQDPIEALRALRTAVVQIARATQRPFDGLDIELHKLRSIVANLGNDRPAPRIVCPPDYRQQWDDYCRKSRADLDPRAIRYLCWDAEVATDPRFHNYLDSNAIPLSARSLQGLVRSCHLRWSPALPQGSVVARVRDRIQRYNGPNRVLEKWKADLPLILGSRGPESLAGLLISHRFSITKFCEEWKLDDASAYVLESVKFAVRNCRDQLNAPNLHKDRDQGLLTYLCSKLLTWEKWPEGEFRQQVAETILSTFAEPGTSDELKTLVLKDLRLGDPRLPRNRPNWLRYDEAAKRMTEWLSRDDISFFFEHAMPPGHNQQKRKAFWLRYVPNIRKSRPLLSRHDRASLASLKDKIGNFGSYDHDLTSAFVLDFGSLVAVEFSENGNACYLYQRGSFDELVRDLWAPEAFSVRQLKSKSKSCAQVTHDKYGKWETTLLQLLVRRGGIWPAE